MGIFVSLLLCGPRTSPSEGKQKPLQPIFCGLCCMDLFMIAASLRRPATSTGRPGGAGRVCDVCSCVFVMRDSVGGLFFPHYGSDYMVNVEHF